MGIYNYHRLFFFFYPSLTFSYVPVVRKSGLQRLPRMFKSESRGLCEFSLACCFFAGSCWIYASSWKPFDNLLCEPDTKHTARGVVTREGHLQPTARSSVESDPGFSCALQAQLRLHPRPKLLCVLTYFLRSKASFSERWRSVPHWH